MEALAPHPGVLTHVVQQHAEEAAQLRHTRGVLVRAPHVGLLLLGRHDERIEAHLDGLLVAGAAGRELAQAQVAQEEGAAGAVFTAAVLALRQRDEAGLDALLALPLEPRAPARRGLASALGWVAAESLQGVVRKLLNSTHPAHRALGLDACRMHRVDPGAPLRQALRDADPALRAAALHAAGALARHEWLPDVRAAMADGEPEVVFQAACAACRLGERTASLQVLATAAQRHGGAPPGQADAALALLMAASSPAAAQEAARGFSSAAQSRPDAAARRRLVRALALLGDTRHVPWLIERMLDPLLAKLAGEAFSWITGIDLAAAQLERLEPPEGAADDGASEDPEGEVPALDEDRDLPWPDAERIRAHWQRHAVAGERLFMGGSTTDPAHLGHVLREGTQRQRRHAALLLALARPDQPLLPVAAPVRRQRRWLGL